MASGTVLSGGEEIVSSGGVAEATVVSSGGHETIYAGGAALGLSVLSGGRLVDDGEVRVGEAGASLDGSLEGSGVIVNAGDLILSGADAPFSGRVAIEGGVVELATGAALGTGDVQFVEPSTGSAVLRLDAADAPAAAGTFANAIFNFDGANEAIDLASVAFVAGASATVRGSTLVLTDGGATYRFDLMGAVASAYTVASDGHGGSLISPKAILLAQATAAFAPSDAAKTAPVSAASAPALAPLLHATAAVSAGRL
jgi:autotransporter passenger strand-loop-strand repeat protein